MYDVNNFEEKLKAPFPYFGGKARMASKIVKLMPPHTVYCEPFFGSGAVMFKKGLPPLTNGDHYREIINDKNDRIIAFFRFLQDGENFEALLHKLKYTLYSKSEHDLARSIMKDPEKHNTLDRAWAFLLAASWGFGGGFMVSFGYRLFGAESSETHYNRVKHLENFRDRLKKTTIFNLDVIDVIKKSDSAQTLFYLDPPYPNTTQCGYKNTGDYTYSQADFEDLITVCENLKGAVLLSCYDNHAVPNTWVKHEFNATMSAARDKSVDKKRIECVWYKPASEPMRDSLIPIAQRHFDHFQGLEKNA